MRTLQISLLFLLFFTLNTTVNAQVKAQLSFNQTFGAGVLYWNSVKPTLDYSPRVNLVEFGNNMTFSFGTHMSLCPYFKDYDNLYRFLLPLVGEFNFGMGSGENATANFGGFIGGGYAYSPLNITEDDYYSMNMGPFFNAGITATINNVPVGLSVSYQKNTNENFINRGFGDAFTLGVFLVMD